mmetsp:Transcript_129549/g.414308  ORF Transcript_129549/g.414308 Transcript_129549/m.414308 type:complete len:83 (+) Transcript_129549:320-568(+)
MPLPMMTLQQHQALVAHLSVHLGSIELVLGLASVSLTTQLQPASVTGVLVPSALWWPVSGSTRLASTALLASMKGLSNCSVL